VSLHELYAKYHNIIQFMVIYIREAHPIDGWWLGEGFMGLMLKISRSKAATDIYDPKTIEERRAVAEQCEKTLQHGIHTYVDDMDDNANKLYSGWPTRLYLIGLDGRVTYAGEPGPFGFKPKELGKAIEQYLALERVKKHPKMYIPCS